MMVCLFNTSALGTEKSLGWPLARAETSTGMLFSLIYIVRVHLTLLLRVVPLTAGLFTSVDELTF